MSVRVLCFVALLASVPAYAECPAELAADPLAGIDAVVAAAGRVRGVIHDPALDVRITSVRELRYAEGADPTLDRPAFVRAASGAAISGGVLYVAQDDANFLAAVDLATGVVNAVTLPAGAGGKRLFEDARGNKEDKMDLESIVALPDGRVLALGSGSMEARFRAVLFEPGNAASSQTAASSKAPQVIDTSAFHRSLAANKAFSGSQLNLEGLTAFTRDGRTWLRLFQRGNGAPGGGLAPVDATGDVPLDDLLAGRATTLTNVREYRLGGADGIRLTFSDATVAPDGSTAFVASAEDSPSATDDGTLHGVVIGSIGPRGGARYGRVLEADGTPSTRKLEGLAWDASRQRWLAVEDPDDPTAASRLVELE